MWCGPGIQCNSSFWLPRSAPPAQQHFFMCESMCSRVMAACSSLGVLVQSDKSQRRQAQTRGLLAQAANMSQQMQLVQSYCAKLYRGPKGGIHVANASSAASYGGKLATAQQKCYDGVDVIDSRAPIDLIRLHTCA